MNTYSLQPNYLPTSNSINHGRNKYSNKRLETSNTIVHTGMKLISPKNVSYFNYKGFSVNKNPDSKYKENYVTSLANLKERIESPKNINSYNSEDFFKGFKSYEVPHIYTKKKSENYKINLFHESLEKSIKYDKSLQNSRNLDVIINLENDKLRNYMNNLEKFVNINSSSSKFPNLIQITKMDKLKTSNLKIANNRYMGERYDPHNYS